jgi:hypothetical protein
LEILNALKVGKQPFQFIVSRFTPDGQRLFDTNIRVSLEDYSIDEDAGNGIDINVEIKLKQYRDFSTKTVTLVIEEDGVDTSAASTTATVTETRATDETPAPTKTPKEFVVEVGNTLWMIAKMTYGDGSKYKKIFADNKRQLDNINALKVGQILMLTK